MKIKRAAFIAALFTSLFLSGCGAGKDDYREALSLLASGENESAILCFEQALARKPENAEYLLGYGMALNRVGRYDEAVDVLSCAISDGRGKSKKKSNKQVYFALCLAEYGCSEFEICVQYAQQAEQIDVLDSLDGDILFTQMSAEKQLGEWETAEELGEKIIEKDSTNTDAYLALAQIKDLLGKSDEAIENYLAAIDADRENADAYFFLYDQYNRSGQNDAANELLTNLTLLPTDSPKNLLIIGRAYLTKQDYDRAEQTLETAVDKGEKEGLFYLAQTAMAQGQYDEALSFLDRYEKEGEGEKNPKTVVCLANIYVGKGEFTLAQDVITQADLCGDISCEKELKKTQVVLYEKQGKYKKAKNAAEEYLAACPGDEQMQKELDFIETRIR